MTVHSAFVAHAPGQGSRHFWFTQARLLEHSLLVTHSGLQFGGTPTYAGKHEHDGVSPLTWHWALGPQGDGMHGLTGSGGLWAGTRTLKKIKTFIHLEYNTPKTSMRLTNFVTTCERISSQPRSTCTYWFMVEDLTIGSNTAGANAWISAFLIWACFVQFTITVYYTLWSASRWAAHKANQTWTNGLAINFSALAIRATRWRRTRMCFNWCCNEYSKLMKYCKKLCSVCLVHSSTHIQMVCTVWMHFQTDQLDNYKLEYGCIHYRWRFVRKYQGKDLCTYFERRLIEEHNHCLKRIRVYNLHKDLLDIGVNTSRFHFCTERLLRTD